MCGFDKAEVVTPSDAEKVNFKALYVGVAGNVTVRSKGSSGSDTLTFVAVPAGGYVLVAGSQVMATGTSASSIIRFW